MSTKLEETFGYRTKRCVNALRRAYSISTFLCNTRMMKKLDCVNALRRAYSISTSTVPSGNPLFMRLPRPIFASNSQNILKIHVFCPFFGLASYFSIFHLKQHPFTFLKLYIPSKNSSIIKYRLSVQYIQ